VLKIDECPIAPDLREQLLAWYQFARLLEQRQQNLEGLPWQANTGAVFEELARQGVHFKWTKNQPRFGLGWSQNTSLATPESL
jgi:hypothetical protein